jgi:thiol:disulfide interchange protein DsbD
VIATLLVTTMLLRGPGVVWKPYSAAEISAAQNLGKPVIIDFYATWCTPCRELEEITFHHPEVVKLAEKRFVMVKVDVTKGGNPQHEELLKRYQVKGVPTLVFLDAAGRERKDLRLVDFLPAEQLLPRMQAVVIDEIGGR